MQEYRGCTCIQCVINKPAIRLYKNIQEYMYKNIQEYTRIYMNIQEYTRIYKNIKGGREKKNPIFFFFKKWAGKKKPKMGDFFPAHFFARRFSEKSGREKKPKKKSGREKNPPFSNECFRFFGLIGWIW